MPKVKLIALTTPIPGKEAEFHDWYQNNHLPEIASIPGVKGGQRFELVARLSGSDPNSFLALYDVEVDDPAAVIAGIAELSKSGRMTPPVGMDTATTYTAAFVECGEYVASTDGA